MCFPSSQPRPHGAETGGHGRLEGHTAHKDPFLFTDGRQRLERILKLRDIIKEDTN